MLNNQDFATLRSQSLGGSDIGAILGLSKFRTPLQVWQEKVGQPMVKIDSLPLRFGSFAEDFVAQEYSRTTGLSTVMHPGIFSHLEHPYLTGHIDRFILQDNTNLFDEAGNLNTRKLLECKTANPYAKDEWGEIGSDEVPMSYLVQCAWYMLLTGCTQADLAVLFSNADFRIYQIEQDKELEQLHLDKAMHFWQEHVVAKIPPAPINESDCKRLYLQSKDKKSVEVNKDLLSQLAELPLLNQQLSMCEDHINQIKLAVMQQMADAEMLTHQGKILATWKSPKPSFRLDTKKLSEDHPELASQYQLPVANSRRLVIKDNSINQGASHD